MSSPSAPQPPADAVGMVRTGRYYPLRAYTTPTALRKLRAARVRPAQGDARTRAGCEDEEAPLQGDEWRDDVALQWRLRDPAS